MLGERDGIHASLLLLRPRRPALAVSSGDPAKALHETPGRFPGGPGMTALREGSPVRVGDTRTDRRWPAHLAVAVDHGIHSLLALPLEFGDEGQCVLSFCTTRPRDFPPAVVDSAAAVLDRGASVLHLAVRLDRYRVLEQDLRTAMSTRTAIDLAVGILMAQDRSDQTGAFALLKRASHYRNLPVRDVAVEIVERFSQRSPSTHFDA
ncbi:GAF and ANTAR domain-containing protein [Brachybacterium paraconglomeratum]|nr:GAF and ANTAR domain-containing protein [Brachybacterium paraconglomeratum]